MATFYWTQDGGKIYPVCQRCGKHQRIPAIEGSLTDAELCNCPLEPEQKPAYAQGWVCPRCGRGNAPWLGTCPCWTIPTTTGSCTMY